ncbi:hypothetical protein [Candidatus Stoquefichus massiliensis]|uniref:hypothetical protein n=1 Tax=Candidatus Stoquefichus massiliensis TaxID=1470350 RepID=UPI000488CFE9|nr:hypothetical protein [Candidatus Stoquefichus massiliensis]
MRIAFIDGSPKIKQSTSGILLEDIKSSISQQAECIDITMHKQKLSDIQLEQLKSVDVFVISCPLYVDGIPGHLLSCLGQLEETFKNQLQINVYGIVNCGFYEGQQARYALNILENWCIKTGLIWSGGIGIGGGGGISQMPNGPRVPINKAFQEMGNNIMQKQIQKNQYVSIAFPRFLYKVAAQFGWRQLMKSNGGKPKDLNKQW